MNLFHHLENTDIYLRPDSGTEVYKLDLSPEGVRFSQTFTETTFPQKTLGNPEYLVKAGVIYKANKASFSFTIPLTKEYGYSTVVYDLLLNTNSNNTLDTFTLFFIVEDLSFVLDKCVFTSGNFIIEQNSPLMLELQGEASRVYKDHNNQITIVNDSFIDNTTLNLVPTFIYSDIADKPETRTFLIPNKIDVSTTYGSYSPLDYTKFLILSSSMEVQNDIKWNKNNTIAGTLNTTTSENIVFPQEFSLMSQSLSGNIKIAFPNATRGPGGVGKINQVFHTNSKLLMSCVTTIDDIDYGLFMQEDSGGINYTGRVTPGPFYTLDMDWRYASNAAPISSILTYITA